MKKTLASIVIINKHDRGIASTIEHVLALNCPVSFELIVVDASNHELADIADRFPAVRWIDFEPPQNKLYSIPEQRNIGITAARGNIIVFIDANCIPDKHWLGNLLAPMLEQGELIVAGVGGSLGGSTLHDDSHKRFRGGKKYLEECPTMNLAIRQEVFEKVGNFDSRFAYGSDVDFSWRSIESGYKIRQAEDAIVYHDWGSAKFNLGRMYRYGQARARLYRKHPAHWRQLFSRDIVILVYPAYMLGLPVTVIWPWYLLLLAVPILRNWRHRPFESLIEHFAYGWGVLLEVVS